MYSIWVFIDCSICTDLISLYKPYVLIRYCTHNITIICISLSRLTLYCACCYVNTFTAIVDLSLSIRVNTGSLYRNVSILNYKRDKDNVS